LYIVEPVGDSGGRRKKLTGITFTKDAIDSNFNSPYEVTNQTLRQRANSLLSPLSIGVVWDIDDDLKFDKITASESDKIIAHITKYVKQRGALVSSDESGNMVVLRANTDGESVGTVEDGKNGTSLSYSAKFDSTKRFNVTKVLAQSPGKNAKNSVVKDDTVPNSRMQIIKAPDSTEGDIKNAGEWERSKSLADALTMPLSLKGYLAPNGERWKVNTLVTVKSDVISIPDGFDFLIRRVQFSKKNSGKSTVLSIVPPQVYSGEPIPDVFL
jgi:prophage tail gpP-like protein